jgi:hypothetical protein
MRALKKTSAWALAVLVILYALTCSGKKQEDLQSQTMVQQDPVSQERQDSERPESGPSESVPTGSDWEEAYAFVRDSIRTEASRFPLKTAEGVRWNRAGNSLEKALLLAQILQDGGETVQIAEGDLDNTAAKNLLGSIFPATKTFSYGADVPLSVPAEDPNLISTVKRHFWVQIESEDKWLDLDPSFPAAKPGRAFASVKETYDPADESLRTRVSLSLEFAVEDSSELESVFSWDGEMEEVADQPLSLSIVAEFQPAASGDNEEKEEGEAAGGVFGALGGRTSKSKKGTDKLETVYNAALTVREEGVADGRFSAGAEAIGRVVLRLKFESQDEVI